MMINVLFDCDDILIDTVPSWLSEIEKRFGIVKTMSDVTDWDITKPFEKEILEGKITKDDIYSVISDDNFWRDIPRIEKMYTTIMSLKEKFGSNIKLSILTASHYYTLRSKMTRVLNLYKGLFEWDDVIVATNKGMVRGDILIDDNFDNCKNFIYNNHSSIAFMRERPYSVNKFDNVTNGGKLYYGDIRTWKTVDQLSKELESLLTLMTTEKDIRCVGDM